MHNRWQPNSGFSKMAFLLLIRAQGCVDMSVTRGSLALNTTSVWLRDQMCFSLSVIAQHWNMIWIQSLDQRQFICNFSSNSNKFMHVEKAQRDGKIILISHYVFGSHQGFKQNSWIYTVNTSPRKQKSGTNLDASLFLSVSHIQSPNTKLTC